MPSSGQICESSWLSMAALGRWRLPLLPSLRPSDTAWDLRLLTLLSPRLYVAGL